MPQEGVGGHQVGTSFRPPLLTLQGLASGKRFRWLLPKRPKCSSQSAPAADNRAKDRDIILKLRGTKPGQNLDLVLRQS